MSVIAVKIKLMPDSPKTNMTVMEKDVKAILEKEGVKNPVFEIEPIAFGLKSLGMTFGWPEEKPLEELEEKLKKITDVSSVQIVDIRRAIG